jgi:hypothetical protein
MMVWPLATPGSSYVNAANGTTAPATTITVAMLFRNVAVSFVRFS